MVDRDKIVDIQFRTSDARILLAELSADKNLFDHGIIKHEEISKLVEAFNVLVDITYRLNALGRHPGSGRS